MPLADIDKDLAPGGLAAIDADLAGPKRDLVGDVKASLVPESSPFRSLSGRALDAVVPGASEGLYQLGRAMVPGSWPGLAATAASFIPGVGVLGALGRTGAAAVGAAGIEALRGGDPGKGALEAGGATLGGEALGGLARAGARTLMSRFDPIKKNVAEAIGNVVPAFKGTSPEATLARTTGDVGRAALSGQFGKGLDDVVALSGDKAMQQAWAALRQSGPPTREMWDKLMGMSQWNLSPTAQAVLSGTKGAWGRGEAVRDLTEGSFKRGVFDPRAVQERVITREAEMRRALGDRNYEVLRNVSRRGETSPAPIVDQPGVAPRVWWHLGVMPTLHGVPHAPRLIGQPEAQSGMMADLARRLGVRLAGSQMEGQ